MEFEASFYFIVIAYIHKAIVVVFERFEHVVVEFYCVEN